MKKKYRAAIHKRITDEQAAIYGPELERLKNKLGRGFTPDEVVQAAKKKNSPLHSFFTWDVHRASRMYWRDQARQLIGSVEVVIIKANSEESIRAYHSIQVPEVKGRIYEDVETIALNPFLYNQVLEFAMRQVKSWQEKYREYSELQHIFEAIDKVGGKAKKKRSKSGS